LSKVRSLWKKNCVDLQISRKKRWTSADNHSDHTWVKENSSPRFSRSEWKEKFMKTFLFFFTSKYISRFLIEVNKWRFNDFWWKIFGGKIRLYFHSFREVIAKELIKFWQSSSENNSNVYDHRKWMCKQNSLSAH
jgi:hypothetical protein